MNEQVTYVVRIKIDKDKEFSEMQTGIEEPLKRDNAEVDLLEVYED